MNKKNTNLLAVILASISIWTILSTGQVRASTLTVDQIYANAYNGTANCIKARTQISINLAREAIKALQQAGVNWAVGEFSKQVDQVQQPFLVKVVQAINTADSNTTQANINAAKAAIDPDLPDAWKNSYSSAVDVIQRRLMSKMVDAINKANSTRLQSDIDAANLLIKELKTAADASIANWANVMAGQLNSTAAVVSTPAEFKSIITSALENFDSEISFDIKGYTDSLYNLNIINSIINEDPILDYGFQRANASMSWENDSTQRSVTITFSYSKTKDQMLMMKNSAEKKAQEILSSIITSGMSDLQKERAIHDYIVNHAEYDYLNYERGTVPTESYTDYGVLVNGVGVCEGYAKAMFRLLNQAGIKCLYVTGNAGTGSEYEPHAWNMVQISGKYYHVDATWDDPISTSGGDILSHDYFNISDTQIAKDHQWDRTLYPQAN